MLYEKEYLISLLSAAIREDVPPPPEKEVDWNVLCEMARKQKISILLLQSISKLEENHKPPAPLMALWQRESVTGAYFFALQAEMIENVLAEAEKAGVDMLILKGTALRRLYPVPELRTMSDCDALIKKEQLDLVKKVFAECGYTIARELEKTIEFSKPDALKFELFYEVFSGIEKSEDFNPDLWGNAVPFMGEHILTPSPEDTFVHAIAHHVKHIRHRGAGLRNLADIVLIAEKYELDTEYILNKINQLNIYPIFCGIMRAAEKYFGLKPMFGSSEVDDNAVEQLMEYMASNGVYGVVNNMFLYDARNADGDKKERTKKYIRRILLPADKLSDRYAYAKKHTILLPVAWAHRLLRGLFKGKKYLKHEMDSVKTAADKAQEQLNILEYFDIK